MFEYGMNEHLKNLQEEIKRCAYSILIDKSYTVEEAQNAIEKSKTLMYMKQKQALELKH